MSKCPWPERLKSTTRSSPACLAASASSKTARIAWAGSGPGMIPSQRAKRTAASNAAVCAIALASTSSPWTSAERLGASPW